MKNLQAVFTATKYHLYYSITNPRIWAGVILILTVVFNRIYPYALFANDVDYPVNFGVVCVHFSDNFSAASIFTSLLLIFSDMPFKNPQQLFLVTRCGKRTWCISQFLYIIVVSIAVMLIIILLTMLMLAGHLSFDNEWGKIIKSALSVPYEKYRIDAILSPTALNSFTPHSALLWCLPVGTLAFITFGSIIFAFNMISNSVAGSVIGALFVGVHFMSFNAPQLLWTSPLGWLSLSVINVTLTTSFPPPGYALAMFSGMFVLSIAEALLRVRKKSDIL